MISKKEISNEIDLLYSLDEIVDTYEEIAASRMRQTRNTVLSVRDFLMDLNKIFREVKSSYKKQVEAIMQQRKKSTQDSFLNRNGKTVYVLLAANTGLYGDIIKRTFDAFLTDLKKGGAEATIIGRLGLTFLQKEAPNIPHTYFDLPDSNTKAEQLKPIMQHLLQYEKVFIYYPLFQNVIKQVPTVESLSGDQEVNNETTDQSKIQYLFEPSLEEIMKFFETEILGAVFDQTVRESQLAKYAARMVSLDQAADNIAERLKQVQFDLQRVKHSEFNRKQLSSLSSISLWK